MQKLKQFLFGGGPQLAAQLGADVRAALEVWRQRPGTNFELAHFQTRYVIVDVATSGLQVGQDRLLGIAAVALAPGGVIRPDESFALDLGAAGGEDDGERLARRLAAFLRFIGDSPLVTYQAPFVGGFLHHLFDERLGIAFQPDWIDLAWLLPDLFGERIDGLVPLDAWLESFAIRVPGRRDALADSVALARLLQVALPRAMERGSDTAGKLIGSSKARRWLRHNG